MFLTSQETLLYEEALLIVEVSKEPARLKIYMTIRQIFKFTAINLKCPHHITTMPAVRRRCPQMPVANNVYACRWMHC